MVYMDWLGHLMISPGKQLSVAKHAVDDAMRIFSSEPSAILPLTQRFAAPVSLFAPLPGFKPPEGATSQDKPAPMSPAAASTGAGEAGSSALQEVDRRFADPSWQQWPYHACVKGFEWLYHLWEDATTGVPGVSPRHADMAKFSAQQWLEVVNPANYPWSNPEVAQTTLCEAGHNLVRGAKNLTDDWQRHVRGLPPEGADAFKVGKDVAATPGKVVLRNGLMELIQYSPMTPDVYAEPVLIVPAWIMKYYILDLSPHNSLVRYLVSQGHTVFMISWKNPCAEDSLTSLDDYRTQGVMAAMDAISQILPERKVHAVGYCLGGTLMLIAAATMGRDGDARLASLSLFAAQGDFTEAGELLLFINSSEVELIDSMMAQQGYLRGEQMAATFELLHADQLIWARAVRNYLLGEKDMPNDLMAWNADTTRMPYRMHSQYLHKLFLNNDLSRGHYEVEGQPIWFTDIHVPCFAVGTRTDHVAPWKSVYKLHLLPLDLTFVLTSGGHNAGIVSEPGHPRRRYQIHARPANQPYASPEHWLETAEHREGSWWTAWQSWLAQHSGARVAAPSMGVVTPGQRPPELPDAPGSYVLEH